MRTRLHQLATALLLIGAAAGACAQIVNPNDMVSGPPKPPATRHQPSPLDDLSWLWAYTKPEPRGQGDPLRDDPKLAAVLAKAFPQRQAMWGNRDDLRSVIPAFTQRYATVTASGNRYVALDGCVVRFCPAHGLLWFDLGPRAKDRPPLIVFAAVQWEEGGLGIDQPLAPYDLWLFTDRALDPMNLPQALTESIAAWDARLAAANRGVPHIRKAVLIGPDSVPQPIEPALTGANRLPPQVDKRTPTEPDDL